MLWNLGLEGIFERLRNFLWTFFIHSFVRFSKFQCNGFLILRILGLIFLSIGHAFLSTSVFFFFFFWGCVPHWTSNLLVISKYLSMVLSTNLNNVYKFLFNIFFLHSCIKSLSETWLTLVNIQLSYIKY